MRTPIFLSLILCAAPALAQPQGGAQTFSAPPEITQVEPPQPRVGEVNQQIKQDLGELVAALDQSNANFTALPYVYDARIGYFGSNEWAPKFKANYGGAIQIKDVKLLESKGNDAKALVIYNFNISPFDEALNGQPADEDQQETLDFKLVQLPLEPDKQNWQIVPPATAPPAINAENRNVLWANVSFYIAQRNLPKPTETPANQSGSNLKQLGLGTLMFVQDYDGVYAFEPRYFIEALSPYVASRTVFQVPDTNEIYSFNGNIGGLNFEKIPLTYKTVLFYEGQNETPIFRYDNRAAICFADGHVALVSPDEAKNLIWKP